MPASTAPSVPDVNVPWWRHPDPAAGECPLINALTRYGDSPATLKALVDPLLEPLAPGALRHRGDLLVTAVKTGSVDMVRALLPFCDPNRTWGRDVPLACAAYQPNLPMLKLLVPVCDPNLANENGDTALILAAVADQVGSMAMLRARKDLRLDQADRHGRTALIRTACTADEQAVPKRGQGLNAMTWLIEQGADPNVQDDQGQTVLMHALLHHQDHLVKRLLDHHAQALAQGRVLLNLLLRANHGMRADEIARWTKPHVADTLTAWCQAQESEALQQALTERRPVSESASVAGALPRSPSTARRSRTRL